MASNLYVVDTHALLWYLEDDPRLSRKAKNTLGDPKARLLLPAIALSEALFILEKGRAPHTIDEVELLERLHQDPRLKVVALDEQVVRETLVCKAIDEMHDRQIVATARIAQSGGFQVEVITRDGNIRASGLVKVAW